MRASSSEPKRRSASARAASGDRPSRAEQLQVEADLRVGVVLGQVAAQDREAEEAPDAGTDLGLCHGALPQAGRAAAVRMSVTVAA